MGELHHDSYRVILLLHSPRHGALVGLHWDFQRATLDTLARWPRLERSEHNYSYDFTMDNFVFRSFERSQLLVRCAYLFSHFQY